MLQSATTLLALAAVASADLNLPTDPLNALLSSHASSSDGYEACQAGGTVIQDCAFEVDSSDSDDVIAECYCCAQGSTPVEPYYSTCMAYITASAPAYTADYSILSVASSFCGSVSDGGFTCGTATTPASVLASASPTSVLASASPTVTDDANAAACISFSDIVESCSSATPGIVTMDNYQVASCVCYQNGAYTTALDRYISSCANYVETASPDEYETYYLLEDFCSTYSPGSGASATFGSGGGSGGFSITDSAVASFPSETTTATSATAASGRGATTTTPTASSSTTSTVTVSPTTTAQQGPAAHAVAHGLAAWVGAVLAFVL